MLVRYATRQKPTARRSLRLKFKLSQHLRCTPFLLFDRFAPGPCRSTGDCLGENLMLTKLWDAAMKAQFPPKKHGRIINAQLKSGALEISASDWMASPAFERVLGNMSAVFIT